MAYLSSDSPSGQLFLGLVRDGCRSLKWSARSVGVHLWTGYRWLGERYCQLRTEGLDPDVTLDRMGCRSAKAVEWEALHQRQAGRQPRHHLSVDTAVWAVDFQFDATTDGRPIKLVSIIDQHTRECLTSLVDRSVTADTLIDELDRLALTRGYPAVLRCDNGPELACAAMADWAGERVGLAFIPPGEPWRNGYVESFNGRVRDECLNINIFWSLAQARVVISDWKEDYNHRRRHSSLGYQAPASYAAACTHR